MKVYLSINMSDPNEERLFPAWVAEDPGNIMEALSTGRVFVPLERGKVERMASFLRPGTGAFVWSWNCVSPGCTMHAPGDVYEWVVNGEMLESNLTKEDAFEIFEGYVSNYDDVQEIPIVDGWVPPGYMYGG